MKSYVALKIESEIVFPELKLWEVVGCLCLHGPRTAFANPAHLGLQNLTQPKLYMCISILREYADQTLNITYRS